MREKKILGLKALSKLKESISHSTDSCLEATPYCSNTKTDVRRLLFNYCDTAYINAWQTSLKSAAN